LLRTHEGSREVYLERFDAAVMGAGPAGYL
jgi:hypothetical protein